jgi:hypothetical protein
VDNASQHPVEGGPPSFFEKDIIMWENKFRNSLEERNLFKKHKLKDRDLSVGTKNSNIVDDHKTSRIKDILKRRKSRLSTNNFNNVDFQYIGNTNEVRNCFITNSLST